MEVTRSQPAGPEAGLRELQEEVARLQRRLGELHGGDLNALRRAYCSLRQHVEALEQEARGMVADLQEFETHPVPPELVAQELGVAAVTAFGVALLSQTIKVLPLKSGGPLIAKGLWLLGAGFVLARLTGGTLGHVAGMFRRNAAKKRRLARKLEAVQERIDIMAALQQWAEQRAGPPPPAASPQPAELAASPEEAPSPPRKVSPAVSSGSSAELVERPEDFELEAAEAGIAAQRAVSPEARGRASSQAGAAAAGGSGQPAARPPRADAGVLQGLRAYAELGKM